MPPSFPWLELRSGACLGSASRTLLGNKTSVNQYFVEMSEQYTVGVICALALEVTAVIAMLDEVYTDMIEQDQNDHNSYRFGRLHHHKVAIATLGSGKDGTNSAAVVATDMKRTFTNLRFGLMVGIGGAAPVPNLEEQDIRLGDVVIGKPSGTYGGVVQFDYGKTTQEDGFVLKGSLPSPPSALLTALTMLEADQELGECAITDSLSAMFEKRPGMQRRYGYPGAENDVLYDAQYMHPKPEPTCESCEISKQIPRGIRGSPEPWVFFGTIGSSNSVMKDAITRDRLRKDLGILCFEMEAAGLFDFPSIVIRGVSDYSDSHKNDRWQRYAAATAAACAKTLLGYITPATVFKQQTITELIEIESKKVRDAMKADREHKLRTQCLQFFDVLPYQTYKNVNPDRETGTCRWVFDHAQYHEVISSSRDNLLWISADPGCGKSVLAKALVDEVIPRDFTICYFFFKDNEHQEDISLSLCCLLHQLFSLVPKLLSHALPIWQERKETLKQDPDGLWSLFLKAATDVGAGNVAVVLDALDECSEKGRQQLMGRLKAFYSKALHETARGAHLKFIVISRPYFDIESEFKNPVRLPAIHLAGERESSQVRAEIDIVIKSKMRALMERIGLDEDIRGSIETKVLSMENRTYLWINLFMDDLEYRAKRGEKLRVRSLEQLPLTVEAAYERLLDRHTDSFRSRRDALLLLHLVVGAKRPMTVKEMDVAFNLALESPEKSLVYELDREFLDGDRLITRIRALCGLFVTIVDQQIYLIHQTAKDFLLNRTHHLKDISRGLTEEQHTMESANVKCWKASIHSSMYNFLWARITLSCLLILDFESNAVITVHGDRGQVQALFRYSATYWGDYFLKLSSSKQLSLQSHALRLYEAAESESSMWFDVYQRHWFNWLTLKTPPTSLTTACLLGHSQCVEQLLLKQEHSRKTSLEWRLGSEQLDPIMASIRMGHLETVKLFLDRGEIQVGSELCGVAIFVSSVHGHGPILKALLNLGEHTEQMNQNQDQFYTEILQFSLITVSMLGSVEIMKLLAANNTIFDPVLEPVIDAAITYDRVELFWAAMDQERTPLKSERERQHILNYALGLAIYHGRISLGRQLLKRGASPNRGIFPQKSRGSLARQVSAKLLSSNTQRSTIHWCILSQAMKVASALMLSEAIPTNIFTRNPPLITAVLMGNIESVSLLVEHGANVNTASKLKLKSSRASNAMTIALDRNHREIAMLLIKRGARVEDHLSGNISSLQTNFRSVMKKLLQDGFGIESAGRDIYIQTIRTAKHLHCQDVVTDLRQHESSITDTDLGNGIPNRGLDTAAKLRAERDFQNFMKNLPRELTGGNFPRLFVGDQNTPLPDDASLADHANKYEHCDLGPLIDKGLDPNGRGKAFDKIALHWAAERNQKDRVVLLLDRASDPNTLDCFGQTPLHYAAENGHEEITRLLLPVTDALIVDKKGRTAIGCAKQKGHMNVVHMLDRFSSVGRREKTLSYYMKELGYSA
jgi:ankyrin repeat protein/nucleoside phosphorylase